MIGAVYEGYTVEQQKKKQEGQGGDDFKSPGFVDGLNVGCV